MTELIGFAAAFCTTIAFLPQAIKVIKTRDTQALSLVMYIIFTMGVFFWLVYGLLINNLAIISANLVTFLLSACILSIKVHSEFIAKSGENR